MIYDLKYNTNKEQLILPQINWNFKNIHHLPPYWLWWFVSSQKSIVKF